MLHFASDAPKHHLDEELCNQCSRHNPLQFPTLSQLACSQQSQSSCRFLCYNKEAIKQKQIICDSPRTTKERGAEEENLNFSLFPSSLLCRLYCVTCQIIEIHYSAESGIEKKCGEEKRRRRKQKLEFDC